MNYNLTIIGAIVIIIGFSIILLSIFSSGQTNTEVKGAFVGFIGPFPIGFGNDKNMLYLAIAISLVLFVSYLIFFFVRRSP